MSNGQSSYLGWEYQIYTSVLLLLHYAKLKSFQQFQIETDFGEDAAAILSTQQQQNIYQIQIKTKDSHYQWEPSDLCNMLLKQDESQPSTPSKMIDYLINNKNAYFIFITSGQVNKGLADLLIEIDTLTSPSPKENLSKLKKTLINSKRNDETLTEKLTENVLKRVFIIQSLKFNDIKLRIEKILTKHYGHPLHKTEDLTTELTKIVHNRILQKNDKRYIDQSNLEQIIGKPNSQTPYPEIENYFVPTPAYQEAEQKLDTNHLIILKGEPATGKTTIARVLVNNYVQNGYEHKYTPSIDALLDIRRAISNNHTIIFELDDIFGITTIETTSSKAIASQLPDLLPLLRQTKGQIKVIITVRESILAQIERQTKLSRSTINNYSISTPYPNQNLMQQILDKHLASKHIPSTKINNLVNLEDFEDLLHIRQFTDSFDTIPEKADTIKSHFEESRPTNYHKWLRKQPIEHKLFLYVLWSIKNTYQIAQIDNIKQIFELATACINLKSRSAFGSHYQQACASLLEIKRIERSPDNTLDFIHPKLQIAVGQYLEDEQIGFAEFITCFCNQLAKTDHPVPQSVAVMLILNYKDKLQSLLPLLKTLAESPYILTLEAIIRFGGVGLIPEILTDEETKEQINSFDDTLEPIENYKPKDESYLLYKASDCKIDEAGHLIRNYHIATLAKDIGTDFMWECGLFSKESMDPDLLKQFETALTTLSITHLNEIERYRFGNWLWMNWRSESISDDDLFKFINQFATDSISFVRQITAKLLSRTDNITSKHYYPIFQNLCNDYHPYVKIAVLERVILPYWRDQSEKIQKEWISIVQTMLKDPIFHNYTAKGLIDMSGSLYEYHAEHTLAQKQTWFMALAPTLVEYGFKHLPDFDRLMTKFDDYFTDYPMPERTNLLKQIATYTEKNAGYSEGVLYTIAKLSLERELTQEEKTILITLIRRLPTWGKMNLSYQFTANYHQLSDPRFKEFIQRPFYNESPTEFISERVGSLIGFLSNDAIQLNDLPPTLQNLNQNNVTETIRTYVLTQDIAFKRLFILAAYAEVHPINTNELRYHPLTVELITEFAQTGSIEDASLIANIVITSEYSVYDETLTDKHEAWFKLFNLFLYNDKVEVCQNVCNYIFAANIASNVHTKRAFLMFIYFLLNHPNPDVEKHAFNLFDNHLNPILKELLNPNLQDFLKEVTELWFDNRFFKKLLNKSKPFATWHWFTIKTIIPTINNWDNLPSNIQQSIINLICILCYSERIELIEEAKHFYKTMQDKISIEQQKQLKNAIYVKTKARPFDDLRGRLKQNERDFALRKLLPKVDWSIYDLD